MQFVFSLKIILSLSINYCLGLPSPVFPPAVKAQVPAAELILLSCHSWFEFSLLTISKVLTLKEFGLLHQTAFERSLCRTLPTLNSNPVYSCFSDLGKLKVVL